MQTKNFEELSTSGIVLQVHASGEADLVAVLLTEKLGKVSVIAKRARAAGKNFSSSLDIFDYGQFALRSARGSLLRLERFHATGNFIQIRDSIDKFVAASSLLESCSCLCEGHGPSSEDESREILELLRLCLLSIAQSTQLLETMRALCIGMNALCELNGYGQVSLSQSKNKPEEYPKAVPSLHLLLANVRIVEDLRGRPLSTRPSLDLLLTRVRQEAKKPPLAKAV